MEVSAIMTKAVDCWRKGNESMHVDIPGGKDIKAIELGNAYEMEADKRDDRRPQQPFCVFAINVYFSHILILQQNA